MPLGDTACLLMRPVPMGGGLTVSEASAREIETINLRTYGWADEYVFGRTQDALAAVRTAARRRPADVVCPKTPSHRSRCSIRWWATPASNARSVASDPDRVDHREDRSYRCSETPNPLSNVRLVGIRTRRRITVCREGPR